MKLSHDDLVAISQRLAASREIIRRLCLQRNDPEAREWMMSIPARTDHDPDLILEASLNDVSNLVAALAQQAQPEMPVPEDELCDGSCYWGAPHRKPCPQQTLTGGPSEFYKTAFPNPFNNP